MTHANAAATAAASTRDLIIPLRPYLQSCPPNRYAADRWSISAILRQGSTALDNKKDCDRPARLIGAILSPAVSVRNRVQLPTICKQSRWKAEGDEGARLSSRY